MKTRTNIVWSNSWALFGLLCLGAGCAGEFESPSVEHPMPGITFLASDVSSGPSVTRGYFAEEKIGDRIVYAPNWDQADVIRIFATNTNKHSGTAWSSGMQPVVYSASQAGRLGKFLPVTVDDKLNFTDEGQKSRFLAIYSPNAVWETSQWSTTADGAVKCEAKTLPSIGTQEQLDEHGRGIFELMTRYSYTEHNPSDGDEVKLNFKHVLSGLVFDTQNTDGYVNGGDYIVGRLSRIRPRLTRDASNPSLLARVEMLYHRGYTTLVFALPIDEGGAVTTSFGKTEDRTSTDGVLKIRFDWNDNSRGYFAVRPLQMADLETPEYLRVSYDFDNMEVVQTHEVARKNWNPGTLYHVPPLDLETLNYLVLKPGRDYDEPGATLILKKGINFDEIFDIGQMAIRWNWTRDALGDNQQYTKFVNMQNISRVISYVPLTPLQKQIIKAFGGGTAVLEEKY